MELFLLLVIPLLIALGAFLWSALKQDRRYLISLKEFLVIVGVVVALMFIGYFLSRYTATYDDELWNGRIVNKQQERVSCEHSYPCNPHPCNCDDKGNCSTCWDTCYEHSNDWDWALYTSNSERIEINRVDRQGVNEPPRYAEAKKGDPTAVVHGYTNYIKANPWSIMRRSGAMEEFKNLMPSYPLNIYDYHYIDRFLSLGVPVPPNISPLWNRDLMEINADLGKKKQVNIIFVVVPTADSSYLHALEEGWLGGKKNDLVIIFGILRYPEINWVRVMSWTRAEEVKIGLRDSLQEIGSLEKRGEIIAKTKELVDKLFVRRPMADFEYLMAGVRPPTWALVTLFVIGIGVSAGLTVFFYREDPFETGRKYW